MTSKPLVWLHGEVKTPPFSARARAEAGYLLRMLQEGERLGAPKRRGRDSRNLRKEDESDTEACLEAAKRRWKKYLADQEED